MKFSFMLIPYAESCEDEVENILSFDKTEWNLIYGVFVRIVRNFKDVYPEVDVKITDKNPNICLTILKKEMTEDEFEYFVDVLSGHQTDNIVNFDSIDYIIKGNITEEKKITYLDRFNAMVRDLAPELISIEKS
jgi:hypothetical protein